MNDKISKTEQEAGGDIEWYIEKGTPILATLGDAELALELIEKALQRKGKTYQVVNTPTMPLMEGLHDYVKTHSYPEKGVLKGPDNLDAFFACNGMTKVPEVLILHRFNAVSQGPIYFVKCLLLDPNTRGDHEAFKTLRQIYLTCEAGGDKLDADLASCIHAVVDIR